MYTSRNPNQPRQLTLGMGTEFSGPYLTSMLYDEETFAQIETRSSAAASNSSKSTAKAKWASRIFALLALLVASSATQAQLPDPGMVIDLEHTAVLITDPQNDFLSPQGVAWGVVGNSVTKNNTIANIEILMTTAKTKGIPLFISPHYYYPTDHGWKSEGALETLMHEIGMFDRSGALSLNGFEGSGADWLELYKPLINDGKTIIASPHKIFGPETNDLVLQLRKRGINKVILGGMSANLCTESHLRELMEQGFEVAVISDATAAAQVAEGDGYQAALVNFRFIANTVWTTQEAASAIQSAN